MKRSVFAVVMFALMLAACGPGQITGVVLDSVPKDEEQSALEGVRVCVDGTETCTTTGADGGYLLEGIPPEGNVPISFELDGFVGQLYATTGTAFEEKFDTALASFAFYAALFADADPTLRFPSDTEGVLWINEATHADGVRAQASEGDGPFFSDDGVAITKDANGTTAAGLGFIYFTHITAAEVAMKIVPSESSPQNCAQDDGAWRGTTEGAIRVPIRPGFETLVVTRCR